MRGFTPSRIASAMLLAAVAAGLLVASAPARRVSDPPLIRINASIGWVSLYGTRAAVEARYGAPESSFEIVAPNGTGVLARYRLHGGLLLVTYDATNRVVAIETDSRHYRTARGVGPGTPATGTRRLAAFRRDFCSLGVWNGDASTDGTDLATVFTVVGDRIASVQMAQAALLGTCIAGTGELSSEVAEGGFLVAAEADPASSGWLRSTPAGIDCPLDCAEIFPRGTTVTIVARPSEGFNFTGWSGACEFLDPCTFKVDGAKRVVAHFRQPPPPPPPPPSEEDPAEEGAPPPEEGAAPPEEGAPLSEGGAPSDGGSPPSEEGDE